MKDRIPTPGKEGRVKLTLDDGTVQYAKMEMADQPTQEGTPLNKATLLSDATAAALGLAGDDPTVDEALATLMPGWVGDIRITARADLGDNWLLCNGDQVSAAEYPELAGVLSSRLKTQYFQNRDLYSGTTPSDGFRFNCITHANGYWVAGGLRYASGSYSGIIAYATSLDGEWTVKTMFSGSSSSYIGVGVTCVSYVNGYWVAGGGFYDVSASRYYACIKYLGDTAPSGTWISAYPWYGSYSGNVVNCITYANGYWVVGGVYCNSSSTISAQIAYSTSLSGTWTTKNFSGNLEHIYCITYADGYWVAGGSYSYYGRIYYGTDLTGTWSKRDLWSNTQYSGSKVYCITYVNGLWVAAGNKISGSTSGYGVFGYATNPGGTWTTNYLDDLKAIKDIAYANGYWVVCGQGYSGSEIHARIAYTTDLTGDWTTKYLWGSGTTNYNCIYGIAYADGRWVAAGQSYDGTTYSGRISYSTDDGILPLISLDDAYAYIRG